MDRNNVCFSQNIVHIFTIPISLRFNNFFFNERIINQNLHPNTSSHASKNTANMTIPKQSQCLST